MSISTIVAPMTGGGTDGPALDAALSIADPTNAHIQAVFLHRDPKHIALPQVVEGMTSSMTNTLIAVAERQVGADRAAARACFDQWRRSNRIGEVETPAPNNGLTEHLTEIQGEMTASLAAIGRLADMVCMVQPAEDDDPTLSNLVAAALLETGKMLYLAPNGRLGTAIKHVTIASNGSREAARAVSLAMPILESTDAVTVLASTSNHHKPADMNAFVASLKWHGVDAKARMFTMSGDQSVRLKAEAMDVGAQVLVLGAYSHSRMREFVFGGVTDGIINAAQMPFLMAH